MLTLFYVNTYANAVLEGFFSTNEVTIDILDPPKNDNYIITSTRNLVERDRLLNE